tara:strand:+ start:929 stop:1225 length:297 start_codon:yes stop_codon:yes gene_type:complete
MIILNACSTRKIVFNEQEEFQFFSVIPNPPKDFAMHHFNDIIVDAQTAAFLRDHPIEWLRSEDKKQILAVNVEADREVCRKFLKSVIGVDGEELLEDE